MRTVAVDARMIDHSGIGTYLKNLLPRLAGEFRLILLGSMPRLRKLELPGAGLLECPAPIYSVSEQWELWRRAPGADVFWSPHYNIPLLPLRARHRLVTIHDVFHLRFAHTLSMPQRLYARLMLRAAVRRSDHILTVSRFSRDEICALTGAPAEKITVVPNGVDPKLFYPVDDRQLLREKLAPLNLPERFILFVGNIKPHKNLMALAQAYLLEWERLKEWPLVLAGKKEGFITGNNTLFRFLRDHPELENRLHFTGLVNAEQLRALYNLATVFAFPSLYEGFGLPPLEAMACGCPVVASAATSLPEVCDDAALSIDPRQPAELARALVQLLEDENLRRRLVAAGHQQAAGFRWEDSAEAVAALLRGLAGN